MGDFGCGKRDVSCLHSHGSLCIQYPFLAWGSYSPSGLEHILNCNSNTFFFSFSNPNLYSNGVMGIGGFKFPDASNYQFLNSQWLNVHDVSWAQITKNSVFSSLNFFLDVFAAQNFATHCHRPNWMGDAIIDLFAFVSIYKLLWCLKSV